MSNTKNGQGTLYIVGTPIGNLEDITLRALRILREVKLIAAEDTRTSKILLSHYDISTPIISFHRHSKETRTEEIIEKLQQGNDVAVISEAGMPGISDPGELLVRECVDKGLAIVVIPGPCALIAALAASGLSTKEFTFIGFLPRLGKTRRKVLTSLVTQPRTLIFYEAPHRLLDCLRDLRQAFGPRQAIAARELTKKFEEIIRADLDELITHFAKIAPKGEFSLVVEGAKQIASDIEESDSIQRALIKARKLVQKGLSKKDAAKLTAEILDVPRHSIYNALSDKDE